MALGKGGGHPANENQHIAEDLKQTHIRSVGDWPYQERVFTSLLYVDWFPSLGTFPTATAAGILPMNSSTTSARIMALQAIDHGDGMFL